MRILGIDPGLRLTGYGVIDMVSIRKSVLVDAGVVRLKPAQCVADRLVELEAALEEIIGEHAPTVVGVEKLYSHYAHPRTAIIMGHARGVILLVAARHKLQLEELSSNRVKQAVAGHGHAGKGQMQRAVQGLWNLPELPEPPDVADALAIAYACAMDVLTRPLATSAKPPTAKRKAIEAE